MQRLAPGFYADASGAVHVDARETCAAMGVEPTPQNIAKIEEIAAESFRGLNPGVKVSQVQDPE